MAKWVLLALSAFLLLATPVAASLSAFAAGATCLAGFAVLLLAAAGWRDAHCLARRYARAASQFQDA